VRFPFMEDFMTEQLPIDHDRHKAWEVLCKYIEAESLRKHALAVEAAMLAYARKFGEDEKLWRVIGLLHDFDYELHPTMEEHPTAGSKILRKLGYSEEVIHAILAHAPHTGALRDTLVKKVIYAVDELCGFVIAVALVRPQKLDGMKPSSVTKKMKDKAFARNVSREEIKKGAAELGFDLNQHISTVIQALQEIAPQLGLSPYE